MNVEAYVIKLKELAAAGGWILHEDGDTPLWLERLSGRGRNVYLSAGIHGDEPAGPEAILELLRDPECFDGLDAYIFPLLNPEGLQHNTRGNRHVIDLNRDYRDPKSREVRAHLRVLRSLPRFDVTVCLHEDWEAKGVYLYFLDRVRGRALAEKVLKAMACFIPIDESQVIDGHPAEKGLIMRNPEEVLGREEWPEALYLIDQHTESCLTLETPSGFALDKRSAAHVSAVRTILGEIRDA